MALIFERTANALMDGVGDIGGGMDEMEVLAAYEETFSVHKSRQ